jgi:hypothetical protein
MTTVSLSQVQDNFGRYDIDKNGRLDRPEIAKASLNLMGQEAPEKQAQGQLFATLDIGGTNKRGLFPDYNRDGGISRGEFCRLAGASGQSDTFESSDFKAVFPTSYQEGGSSIGEYEMGRLRGIGEGNLPKFQNPASSPSAFNSFMSLLPPQMQPLFGLLFGGYAGSSQEAYGERQPLLPRLMGHGPEVHPEGPNEP